jgi:hypothetical protein
MTKLKSVKAWAVIQPEFEIPICSCPITKEKGGKKITFNPWAIFIEKSIADKVKEFSASKNLKVVPIKIVFKS